MDNLAICKRIAEIEGVEVIHSKTFDIQRIAIKKHYYSGKLHGSSARNIALESEYFKHNTYNPLTDDALCFQLMVKYKVWRWSNPYCGQFNVCIRGVQGWVTAVTFNKAILLAIIEAHKD